MTSSWVNLNPGTYVLIRDRRVDTDVEEKAKCRPMKAGGTDWSSVCTAKGHLESEETRKHSPSERPEGTNPANTLISGFWSAAL